MKHNKKQYLLGTLAVTALLLTGCAKDTSMTDTTTERERIPATISELTKALSDIDDISGIELQHTKDGKDSIFFFDFEQPLDHHHPEIGTFKQHVALKFVGFDNHVVLYTNGYALGTDISEIPDIYLRQQLNANMVFVEHRYFGSSLPGASDELDYTYMDAEQQSYDLHNIVRTLKQHFFKTGKWVSTGCSKDGIASALYAYYSDQNGWKDIDLFVPVSAPFMPGTTENGVFSCMDSSPGIHQMQVCGSGYPEGSDEAVASQRIKQLYNAICTNEVVRNACIHAVGLCNPDYYKKIVEQYNNHSPYSTGDLTKDLTALTYYHIADRVFNFFSSVSFSKWAKLVPDPVKAATDKEELFDLTNFISMETKQLEETIAIWDDEANRRALTRSSSDQERFWEYLKDLRGNSSMPYEIHAFKELGYADIDYSAVDGTFLTAEQVMNVIYVFSVQNKYQSLYPQDKGKLMRDFRQWVYTESTQPIIFLYAKNDPWTGARPDDAAIQQNPMTKMIIDTLGTHSVFMSDGSFTKDSGQAFISALNTYLATGGK